jgi:hypothetical protein
MTRNGALAGMLVGGDHRLVWKQFGWLGLYEMVPGQRAAGQPRAARVHDAVPGACWRARWRA